jgi:uncharacterized protein YceH (UPF0502 family)
MDEVAVATDNVGMEPSWIITIVLAFIGVLKGGDIWKFFTEWVKTRRNNEVIDLNEDHLKEKIADLEFEIAELNDKLALELTDKGTLYKEITELKIRVAVLKEKLENHLIQSRGNDRRRKVEELEER